MLNAKLSGTSVPCDIVLLPDEDQAELAAECSRLFAEQGSLFTLDNQNFYAHASLYMFTMDEARQQACIEALQDLASGHVTLQLDQDGYYYQDSGFGKGYLDVQYKRNQAVDLLQQAVIDTFNPLRAGMRESDKAKMQAASGLKLENLQKYGYPFAGELFRPHITFARLPVEIEPNLSVLPAASQFTGLFSRLGLFEMGSNGTCIRKIADFTLTAARP